MGPAGRTEAIHFPSATLKAASREGGVMGGMEGGIEGGVEGGVEGWCRLKESNLVEK